MPVGNLWCSARSRPTLFRLICSCAQKEARVRGTGIHLHVAQDEREQELTLRRAGLRAIPHLDWIGMLAPDLMAVHLSTATKD
jgi:cytosine/adenosine deaminase-related metal-dependent hydrolase